MDRRPFGSTAITVSALGMGCGKLGSVWHQRSDKDGKAAVQAALEGNITFFDTADCYGLGRSERLLGDVIRRRWKRDELVIATKCGLVKTPAAFSRAVSSSLAATPSRTRKRGFAAPFREASRVLDNRSAYSPEYIKRSVDASLRRLRTDYLDILLLHSPSQRVLASGGFSEVFERLKSAGKIRACGVSLRSSEAPSCSLGRLGIDCIELEFNLCSSGRTATRALLSEAAQAGLGVIARQPFASGALPTRARSIGLRGLPIGIDDLRAVRKACLQFALADHRVSVVIAGMTSCVHVRENVSNALSAPFPEHLIQGLRRSVCGSEAFEEDPGD